MCLNGIFVKSYVLAFIHVCKCVAWHQFPRILQAPHIWFLWREWQSAPQRTLFCRVIEIPVFLYGIWMNSNLEKMSESCGEHSSNRPSHILLTQWSNCVRTCLGQCRLASVFGAHRAKALSLGWTHHGFSNPMTRSLDYLWSSRKMLPHGWGGIVWSGRRRRSRQ